MRASITVSRIYISLLMAAALSLCPAPSSSAPTMQWAGDQTVTGGVNVGEATDAGPAQVKVQSSSVSPNVAWRSISPGTGGSVGKYAGTATAPYGAWLPTPGYATGASNSIWAYTTSQYAPINLTNFALSIPSGKMINGIAVTVLGAGADDIQASAPEEGGKALCCPPPLSGGSATVALQLIGSSGSLIGSPVNMQFQSTAGNYQMGNSTYLWGTSGLTVGDVNSVNFGVQIKMTEGSELDIDSVYMTVYYNAPDFTYGQWMAGSYGPDASWRLAQSLTSFASPSVAIKTDGKVGIGTTTPGYRLEVNGDINAIGSVRSNGTVLTSSRDFKMGITPVPAMGTFSLAVMGGEKAGEPALETRTGAWDLLDNCNVVDYEYKKIGLRYRLFDGREVDSLDGLTSTVTRVVDGNRLTEEVSGEALVVDEFPVWLEEGSGKVHRGFIAEEVPAEFTEDGKSVMISDITANNTAALKEAKRRILELEKEVAALTSGKPTELAAPAGPDSQPSALSPQSSAPSSQSSALSTQSSLSDAEVLRLTESVLRRMGIEPWVEITPAEAWEEVDEIAPVSAVETVTRYRFNPETRLAEAYSAQETVTRQEPTGRRIVQLKKDVRLDEKTGKFYRWCGLGGATAGGTTVNGTANVATPAQAAALGKLSPILSVLGPQVSRLKTQASVHGR